MDNIKFTISSLDLKYKVVALYDLLSNKNAIQILSSFLCKVENEVLSITASDGDNVATLDISLYEVDGQGAFTISGKPLFNVVRSLSDQPIKFDVSMSENKAIIKYNNCVFNVPIENTETYPEFPTDSSIHIESEIASRLLIQNIENTIFAVDELRPAMSGIYFDFINQNLTMVATNGFELITNTNRNVSVNSDASFILPKKTALLLKKILNKETQKQIKIRIGKNIGELSFNGGFIKFKLIEGNYPNYKNIFPTDNNISITLEREMFISALKRVFSCSDEVNHSVWLNTENGGMKISTENMDFAIKAQENVPCNIIGSDVKIRFNIVYLIEILKSINSESVCIKISTPQKPAIITPIEEEDNTEIKALLMPMYID